MATKKQRTVTMPVGTIDKTSFKHNIKNKKYILSSKIKSFSMEYILLRKANPKNKADIKLSDVFHFLPNGFVYKDETGIGATTLEIRAERNSIIVEPLKITASAKAYENNALYVGGPTTYTKGKTVSINKISKYITDKSIQYKKIIVVADSLSKVLKIMDENNVDHNSYFLLIDEIDSFQLDSVFRLKMDDCLLHYKKQHPNMRAMLSATKISFSDPELKSEPISFIKYENYKPRNINVIYSYKTHIKNTAANIIKDKLNKFPDDKFFIAYNSVTCCYDIIQHLITEKVIDKKQVKLYCSNSNKDKVGDLYAELDSDKLDAKLNFFTSAYFTGFDLKDNYHLISISGNNSKVHALSDRRLKQIAGRCRNTLLSETIIHDKYYPTENVSAKMYTKEELILAAEGFISSMKCIKNHFSKYPVFADYQNLFIEKMQRFMADYGLNFVKHDSNKKPYISYLNIDAFLEGQRIQNKLYLDKMSLTLTLREYGNHVHFESMTQLDNITGHEIEKTNRQKIVKDVLKTIRDTTDFDSYIESDNFKKLTPLAKKVTNDYINLSKFVEPSKLLDKMEKVLLEKGDSRAYNNFIQAVNFYSLPDESLFVDRFKHYFPLNTPFYSPEILHRVNHYLKECNVPIEIESQTQAVRFVKNICRSNRKTTKNEMKHKLLNYNKHEVEITAKRPNFDANLMPTEEELKEIKKQQALRDLSPASEILQLLGHT